ANLYGREPRLIDSVGDAATTLLFLLAAEAITLQWSPLDMPKALFFRGAAACVALLPMFRMLSRPLPQPDPNTPLWPDLSPEQVYWRLVRFNLGWIFMFYNSIMMFCADGPSYIDNARGALPGTLFATWIMIQTNRLI